MQPCGTTKNLPIETIKVKIKQVEKSMIEKHKAQIDALEQQLNETLQKHAEESKSKELFIKKLEEDKQQAQKLIEKYYTQILGIDFKLSSDFKLELDFQNEKHKDLVEGFSSFKLPEIKRMLIKN